MMSKIDPESVKEVRLQQEEKTVVDPESVAIVAVIGAIGTAATYIAFKLASVLGGETKVEDWLPLPPPSPPIPRFLIKRPELIEKTKGIFKLE